MRLVLFVALGGAAGSAARHALGSAIQLRSGGEFPLGTLMVNVTGSLLLGFLFRYALETPAISTEMRALLTAGFCGGYTTFSTFSYETVKLLEDGDWRRAGLYAGLSVAVSLIATVLGMAGAAQLLAVRRAL